jgi:hypothetical protein
MSNKLLGHSAAPVYVRCGDLSETMPELSPFQDDDVDVVVL